MQQGVPLLDWGGQGKRPQVLGRGALPYKAACRDPPRVHTKGNRSVPVSPAVFEVHDSDVESLLQSLRDESQAINDGVVMLRGLPFSSTEDDIADFFSGNSA